MPQRQVPSFSSLSFGSGLRVPPVGVESPTDKETTSRVTLKQNIIHIIHGRYINTTCGFKTCVLARMHINSTYYY